MQSAAQDVATFLIGRPDLLDAILRALQRHDGSDLDRCERTVVVIALDARQCGDEVRIADHEAYAPAGHVVALREREEFNGDIARARNLHDRRRPITIEDDVRIGQIVYYVNAI